MNKLAAYYRGKTILVTGHTGFKGSWLGLWLRELGAEVVGYALPPDTQPNLHELISPGREFLDDIRNAERLKEAIAETRPDFVFHLAAQPLVRRAFAEPMLTMETNVMGTLNVLEAVRHAERRIPVLIITTDKCYENLGWNYGYRETDAMGGHDVYSMSKAACELAVASWRRSFFQGASNASPIATARAGNVIGGGDYAQDRIVPDWVRAMIKGQALTLRNPHATRPWQHVLDCLSGYLWLGVRLAEEDSRSAFADAFNFGPALQSNVSVGALVKELFCHWPGEWIDASDPKAPHEASRLHLSIDKAAAVLNWHPTWNLKATVANTVKWYQRRHVDAAEDMAEFSASQIRAFTHDAAASGAPWASN